MIENNKTLNQRLAKEYGLQNTTNFRLEDFNYGSDLLTDVVMEKIKEKAFTGVTVSRYNRFIRWILVDFLNRLFQGNVTFDENGIRTAHRLAVYQYRSTEGIAIDKTIMKVAP